MDTIIKVKCIDQTLTLINSPVIASGGLNENKLECEFCEKWDGFSKTAVFYQDKKNVYYSVLDENDTCIIPKEATASKGTMFFGIFGSKGDVTRTSEILRYKIDEGAITEDLKPSDPTPDIYEQILAKLQEIREAEAAFETNITNQQNTFESKITEQQNNYEASLTKKENDYESDLNSQWSTYKSDLTKQQNTFESNINDKAQKISDDEKVFETKITNQQNNYETDLSGQWSTYKSDTDAEIKEKLSHVYRPCGSVANYEALPTDAEIGDVYNLLDTGVNWAWTGTEWDSLAGIIDISNYYTKSEADTLINKKVNVADIVDNLATDDSTKVLSAKQGKVLNDDVADLEAQVEKWHLSARINSMASNTCSIKLCELASDAGGVFLIFVGGGNKGIILGNVVNRTITDFTVLTGNVSASVSENTLTVNCGAYWSNVHILSPFKLLA